MKKTLFVILLSALILTGAVFGEKLATLSELTNPRGIMVDDTQIYINMQPEILIYSLTDFKLVKRFGKSGQGPKEFQIHAQVPLHVNTRTDKIIVNSFGKLSFFTKKGEYIEEKRALSRGVFFQPLGKNYIGRSFKAVEGTRYDTYNLYDGTLKTIREVAAAPSQFQQGKGTFAVSKPFIAIVHKGKVIMPGKDDASIDIFDEEFKKISTITLKQEKRTIPQEFKDGIINFYKTDPGMKNMYQYLKPIRFPDAFPVISTFFPVDDKIYVATWFREKKGEIIKNEFLVYDLEGKFIKRLLVPIKYMNVIGPYPMAIAKGKFYQLVENDNEEWELHVSAL